jgi:site-specific recombinase XerD
MNHPTPLPVPVPRRVSLPAHRQLPAIVVAAGPRARATWEEFFLASLRNAHTRAAYLHAVRLFFAWLEPEQVALHDITPAHVGVYFAQHRGSPPTRKQHLAALRALFDLFVTRHLMVLNPAASVRSERYQAIEGKTPEISVEQARALMASIKTSNDASGQEQPLLVGLRDRAIIGMLICTAARAGAVAKLRLKHFAHDGTQWTLRFEEKGGKSREIPARHDLEGFLLVYMKAAGIETAPPDSPLFRSACGRTGQLTGHPMSGVDLCRMVKRRLKDAGLPSRLSPHSFRVATITDLLTHGATLEEAQYLAGHADPRTTRLYDRRQKRVTRNLVERISILNDS